MKAILALEDGRVFAGRGFGAPGTAVGEIVFHTGLTGYQEILTDPSYRGQIVTLTYPHIGNYGVNEDDAESSRIQAEGLVVRERSPVPSHHRATSDLDGYLREHGVVAIEGIDTRALTRHIREKGAMRAVLSTEPVAPELLVERARRAPSMLGADLVGRVTCRSAYRWPAATEPRWHVVAYDFGIKRGILRALAARGVATTVVPATTPAEEALRLEPHGILLSNGPGDPEPLEEAVATVRALLGRRPLFGICLGHQVLARALGGRTYKLRFGHHGANHPVRRLDDGAVEITSQNHGFAVDPDSLRGLAVAPTHENLNDGTLEGFRVTDARAMAVQYHPEASPGPHDASYLFDRFCAMLEEAS